jgi:hypothetical protein
VSNSSSSSFVIFARKASLSEVDDERVMLYLSNFGEGMAYGRPTQEMINWLKQSKKNQYDLYYEYFSFSEEKTMDADELMQRLAILALNPPKDKIIMKTFEKSYYFPESLDELIDNIGE